MYRLFKAVILYPKCAKLRLFTTVILIFTSLTKRAENSQGDFPCQVYRGCAFARRYKIASINFPEVKIRLVFKKFWSVNFSYEKITFHLKFPAKKKQPFRSNLKICHSLNSLKAWNLQKIQSGKWNIH